jgi:hypothetical protein
MAFHLPRASGLGRATGVSQSCRIAIRLGDLDVSDNCG